MTFPDVDIWDKLLVKLAYILEDARWTIENYCTERVELCEVLITTIQPILHYASYIGMNKFIMIIIVNWFLCHISYW